MTPKLPLILALALGLTACGDADAPPLEEAGDVAAQASPTVERPTPERMVRWDGIGYARIGMTVGELRAALPPELVLGALEPFLVDIDALPVIQGADTLYLALFPAGEAVTDASVIELLATTHPDVRTSSGLGPGATLAAAAALYGEPRLSYSTNEESREWAAFPYLEPSILVRVRPGSDADEFAGEYSTAGEYNETSQYHPDARVFMIVVRRE